MTSPKSSNEYCLGLDDWRILRPRLQDVAYREIDETEYFTDESEAGCFQRQKANTNRKSSMGDRFMEDVASSFDDSQEEEKSIMIGADYQAIVPDVLSQKARAEEQLNHTDTSICTWMPPDKLSDEKVDRYVKSALEAGGDNYPYTVEQVLGILYCSDYRTKAALEALKEYSPESDGWTFEEKIVFEQALEKHGKNFKRIVDEIFPTKSIGSIIKRYYERKAWTKNRTKKEPRVFAEPVQEVKKDESKNRADISGSNKPKLNPKMFLNEDIVINCKHILFQKVQKILWEKKKEESVLWEKKKEDNVLWEKKKEEQVVITIDED